ncbi:hypothetical protein FS837_009406 [Tulasnella sp. UAMH 9824]|nr:hypothetical protein FS837_009406 [Tulasnella sp. UAMH 9824]
MSNTPSIRALERLSGRVSKTLVKGRSILSQLPVVGRVFRKNLNVLPLQIGCATHIVIVSLSYPGMHRIEDDASMELNGTKYDLFLLLQHFDYRHDGNPIKFTLIHDFDVDFTDSTGVRKIIPKVDAGRDSIRTTIKRIMRTAEPTSKIAFFYGGHGEYAEVNMMNGTDGDESDFQCIIAGDGRRIYGKELRSWFCDARYSSVAVTAVFDTCHSAGSMGLPYSYYAKGKSAGIFKVSSRRVPIPLVQISAAQIDQSAYSRKFADGYYGQLTHCLVQYLENTECPTMQGLVAYLDANCDPTGEQVPQALNA